MNVTDQILKRRAAGKVTCATIAIDASGPATATADRVAVAHGFKSLGDAWLEISAHEAHAIVTSLLHRDLVGGNEIMPQHHAEELATAFLDLAPEPHSYFTNGEWNGALEDDGSLGTTVGWDPISTAAFDAGVVCVGDGMTAILWVEEN